MKIQQGLAGAVRAGDIIAHEDLDGEPILVEVLGVERFQAQVAARFDKVNEEWQVLNPARSEEVVRIKFKSSRGNKGSFVVWVYKPMDIIS